MNQKLSRRAALHIFMVAAASTALLFTLLAGGDNAAVHAQTAGTPTSEATSEATPEATPGQGEGSGVQNLPPLEGKLNPPKYPNMDSNLNRIVEQAQTGRFSAQAAAASAPLHKEESVAVTLYISEGYADAIADFLETGGASPRNIGIDYIEAYIPVSLLPAASQREGVISIRTIIPPQPAQGVVVSEGAAAHGAPAWHDAGFRGQGVKIGVIDTGFEGFQSLMGTELPSTVQVRCYPEMGVFTSSISDCTDSEDKPSRRSHGTAVTEALFDIAPDATYYIANGSSWGDLQTTIQWMVEQNVDVINMSLSWTWDGPGDGTSPYRDSPLRAVDTAVASGIAWVNAAGNYAERTWTGAFNNTDVDGWHNFVGEDECNIVELEAEEEFIAQLRWDDIWFGASRDLDLYLYRTSPSGNRTSGAVATSEEEQLSGQYDVPREVLYYTPTVSGAYCLAVFHYRGFAPSWIQLQAWKKLEHYVESGSIGNPAESANPGLLAVGAAPWDDTSTIETFSSRGPTPDGRIKPEIVGADDTYSAAYGEAWIGTSVSSAHVAGLAALVKQRFPEYTPPQVAEYLKNNAEPRGDVPNDTWGYGFARLPVPATAPSPEPTPTTASCVETLTGSTTVSGSWTSDCLSVEPAESGSGDRFARFYAFALAEAADVSVTLESEADTYLYLREGVGADGRILADNDDIVSGNTNSEIDENLSPGDYTIEATTFNSETTGDFTLTVVIDGSTAPPPSPEPPPDYRIEDAACNEDDLVHLGGFTLDAAETEGPTTYDAPGYRGITGYYENLWVNTDADAIIVCSATQYDNIHNARWNSLNYSRVIQGNGATANLLDYRYEQAFVSPYIGDDMLAYRFYRRTEDTMATFAVIRFINADTLTVTRVYQFLRNTKDYPDIGVPEGIARRIAARVMPQDDTASQGHSQGYRQSLGFLEMFE